VRLAQDFNMRYTLVEGQGNFGSVDGDPPAAMRYTEARPRALAEAMMADLDKETVDFVPNYDETTEEPTVLPTTFRTCSSTGRRALPSAWPRTSRRTTCAEVIDGVIATIEQREGSPRSHGSRRC
jgi:DNA gyrase subunit A